MTNISKKLPKRKRQKPGDRHYVNNKEFYADMVAYNELLTPAKEDYSELLSEAEENIKQGMNKIEQEFKDSIESGRMLFSEAKMIHDQEKEELEESNKVESWYTWRPNVPDAVAKKILLICKRLRYKPNFINYSYVDEMVLDAVENCIKYACKFNPEKSENPFSYFTTIANNAFIRRIQLEQKNFLTKAQYVQQSGVYGSDFVTNNVDTSDSNDFSNSYRAFLRNFYDVDIVKKDNNNTERKKRKCKNDNTTSLPMSDQ